MVANMKRRLLLPLICLFIMVTGKYASALVPLDTVLLDGNELDVSYGTHERNILDFWLATPDSVTPVAVFIHGGGFVAGSKERISVQERDALLAAGISVASINYRYTKTDSTADPFPAPQYDAGKAIQFLRYMGEAWRIDPERVGAFGNSAGACASMWLGMHPDLKDTNSANPRRRMSTRLTAIAPNAGQSSVDPEWIKQNIPGGTTHEYTGLLYAFGVSTFDSLTDPSLRPLIEKMSAINHVTPDDPPVYMYYGQANDTLAVDAAPSAGIHHPMFGIKFKEKLDSVGVEAVLDIMGEKIGSDPYGSRVEFLIAKLLAPVSSRIGAFDLTLYKPGLGAFCAPGRYDLYGRKLPGGTGCPGLYLFLDRVSGTVQKGIILR